jgi:hypothetical protein
MLSEGVDPVRARFSVAVLLAAVAVCPSARADEADLQRARALFDEAGELEREGRWSAAQEKLRAALRIRETAHLRYALGWALENDDKLLEAKAEYRTALRLADRGGADEVRRLATERVAEIDAKTPIIEVRLGEDHGGRARVVVDGRATPLQGRSARVPVNPGARVVRVVEGSGAPTERIVYVARGETRVVDLGTADDGSAPRASEDGPREITSDAARGRPAPVPVVPWILVGGGAALAVGGVALFASSSSDAAARDDSLRQWCTATACVDGRTATIPESAEAAALRRDAFAAADRGNMKQLFGGILGGVGLVTAGVGAYLLVRNKGEGQDTAGTVTVSGAPLPGGGMAGAAVRF